MTRTRAPWGRLTATALATTLLTTGLLAGGAATSPANALATAPGTWKTMPTSPLPAGYQTVSVWTGKEMLITTLSSSVAANVAAAAYNPATNRWRKLPTPPGYQSVEGGPVAVWTGKEMLVYGGPLHAAYNPTTNRWRRMSTKGAVQGPGGFAYAWTGRLLLQWGGGCCADATNRGSAYNPVTDTWKALPKAPLSARFTTGTWTGKEFVVVGGVGAEGTPFYRNAAAYSPTTNTWRKLPAMPKARAEMTLTWTGREVVAIGGRTTWSTTSTPPATNFAYSPAKNTWRTIRASDMGRYSHAAVWAKGTTAAKSRIYVWGGKTLRAGEEVNPPNGIVYAPSSNTWKALPKSPLRGRADPVAAWTGKALVVWGGAGFRNGAVFTPR